VSGGFTGDGLVIKDEYRQHMRTYSRDTAVMSFIMHKHPDYQALRGAGSEIIPYLLADLFDPDWHCDACLGYGQELVPTWREEWEQHKTHPPRQTGNICSQCNGKGNVCSWAAMTLLFEKTGDDAPTVEDGMRGRHDVLTKLWRKWAEQRGYFPPTPVEPSGWTKLGRVVVGIFKLWGEN
jgi:hypothetical protein